MLKDGLVPWDVTEEEIRNDFRLLTARPITRRCVSVGKLIARTAQKRVVVRLKSGLKSLPGTNQYLVEADVIDELFRNLDMADDDPSTKVDFSLD